MQLIFLIKMIELFHEKYIYIYTVIYIFFTMYMTVYNLYCYVLTFFEKFWFYKSIFVKNNNKIIQDEIDEISNIIKKLN